MEYIDAFFGGQSAIGRGEKGKPNRNVPGGGSGDITLRDGRLIIRPLPRPAYALEKLLYDVTKDNLHEEIDFGEPTGRESL